MKAVAFVSLIAPANAIIVAGNSLNPSDPNYIGPYDARYSAASYSGVVRVNLGGNGLCSGSLFGPSNIYVLTAAHCVADASGNKITNLSNYNVAFDTPTLTASLDPISAIYIAPGYVGGGPLGDYENDLAVVQLQNVAPADAASYSLYANINEIGREVILVGQGAGGTGYTGATVPPSTDRRNRRMGLNDYNAYAQNGPNTQDTTHILFDFDSGSAANNVLGSLGRGLDEVTIAGGDSGGPSFDFVTGAIIGVHSYTSCLVAQGSNNCASPPDFQAGLAAPGGYFGELGADTRVSLYTAFLSPFTNTSVPEPGTWTLLGSGFLVIALAGRRRRSTCSPGR